jgi:cytochrome P450
MSIPGITSSEGLDLIAVTASEDPDGFWAVAREQRPVFHSKEYGCWVVSRHEDVRTVLSDAATFSSQDAFTSRRKLPQAVLDILGEPRFMAQNPINIDPPAHTPIRRVWGRALMRRQIKELEPVLHVVANDLLDMMRSKGNAGDLMADFASPFPASVILCALLSVPPEEVHRHVAWGHSVVLLLGGDAPVADLEAAAHSHVQHLEYWSNQLEDRRRCPRDDLLTAFVEECKAEPEIDLSPRALAYLPLSLSTAGHVTTAQAIAFGAKLLLEHPDQRDAALEDPLVMAAAVEEILRFEAPAQMLRRTTVTNVEIGGVAIPAGAHVLAVIGSANRDPSAYQADPSTFDVRRANAAQHLTFGRGAHFCLGAPLARYEISVALSTLFARLRNLRVARNGRMQRIHHSFHRGFERFEIEWDSDPV